MDNYVFAHLHLLFGVPYVSCVEVLIRSFRVGNSCMAMRFSQFSLSPEVPTDNKFLAMLVQVSTFSRCSFRCHISMCSGVQTFRSHLFLAG